MPTKGLMVVFAAVLLTGCGTPAPKPTVTDTTNPSVSPTASIQADISLTKADTGKTITVASNQVIQITLDSNISTGYMWQLATAPDTKVLGKLSSVYQDRTPGTSPIVGAPGKEVWQFLATGRGTTTFKMGYARAGTPNDIADQFSLTLVVQ